MIVVDSLVDLAINNQLLIFILNLLVLLSIITPILNSIPTI